MFQKGLRLCLLFDFIVVISCNILADDTDGRRLTPKDFVEMIMQNGPT